MESKAESTAVDKMDNHALVGVFLHEFGEALCDEKQAAELAQNIIGSFSKSPKERYQDDFYFDIVKPCVSKLIRLKNDTAKSIRLFDKEISEKSYANEGTDYAREILVGLVSDIEAILLDYDVQPYVAKDSVFDPIRQHMIKKVATRDEALDKTVAESVVCGYERKELIVAKEWVSVYVLETDTVT